MLFLAPLKTTSHQERRNFIVLVVQETLVLAWKLWFDHNQSGIVQLFSEDKRWSVFYFNAWKMEKLCKSFSKVMCVLMISRHTHFRYIPSSISNQLLSWIYYTDLDEVVTTKSTYYVYSFSLQVQRRKTYCVFSWKKQLFILLKYNNSYLQGFNG